MDEETFRFHMNRMAKAYTKNAFPGPRMDIIYAKMRPLESKEFSQVCDEIIATTTSTPTIKHFLESARPHLERAAKRRVESVMAKIRARMASCVFCSGQGCNECSCQFCFNNGVVTAFRRGAVDQTGAYVFRCSSRKCDARKLVGKSIPVWDANSNDYVMVNPREGIGNTEAYAIANNLDTDYQRHNYDSVQEVVTELVNKTKL